MVDVEVGLWFLANLDRSTELHEQTGLNVRCEYRDIGRVRERD